MVVASSSGDMPSNEAALLFFMVIFFNLFCKLDFLLFPPFYPSGARVKLIGRFLFNKSTTWINPYLLHHVRLVVFFVNLDHWRCLAADASRQS